MRWHQKKKKKSERLVKTLALYIARVLYVTLPIPVAQPSSCGRCSTAYASVCHTPPQGRFSRGGYLHSSWNSATGAKKKRSVLEKSRREKAFRPRIYRSVLALLAPSWLSSNRAWKTAPGGCDIFTVLYGRPWRCPSGCIFIIAQR